MERIRYGNVFQHRIQHYQYLRPKKIGVFPLTCRKKIGSVGRKIVLFFYKFLFNKIRSKMFLWVTFHHN